MDIRDLIQKADVYGKQSEQTQKQIEEGLLDWFKDTLGLDDEEAEKATDAATTAGANPNTTPPEDPSSALAAQQQGGGEGGAPNTGATASGDQGDGTRGTTLPGTSTTTQGNTVGQTDPNNSNNIRVDPNVGTGTTGFDDFDTNNPQQGQAGPDGPTVGNMPAAQNPSGQNDAEEPATSQDSQKDLMTRYNEGGKQAMPEVEKLQQDLKDLGFDPNGVDGKYGNGTYKAVQEFQQANGLQVDGQAGPATLAKIEELKAGGASQEQPQGDSAADVAQDDAARGNDTDQANPAQSQDTQPNAETQEIIDQLNDLISQMMPAPTLSASADQDSITAMRGAINLAESFLREATEEQKAKLGELLAKLGDTDWAKDNGDAYQAFVNRANAAMNAGSGETRASAAPPADASPNASTAAAAGRADAADAGQRGPDDGNRGGQQPNNLGPDGQRDGDDLGNAPTAPKVSKEVYIQMAPDRPASATNFNVAKMKAKYPTPYVEMPNTDGTVTRGYGPEKNLQHFVDNAGKKLKAKLVNRGYASQNRVTGGTPSPTNTQPSTTQNQQRGTLAASKEYTMKNKINEAASMNISADNAAEIAELLGILKNAGMPDAAPVADMHMPEPQGPMPCATCGGDHGEDSPCGGVEDWDNSPDEGYGDMMDIIKLSGGPNSNKNPGDIRVKDPRQNEEEVDEDGWDNSPDEEYKDDDYMYQSGGIHKKKKAYAKAQDGDNAMAVESIKSQLYKALEEKLQNK